MPPPPPPPPICFPFMKSKPKRRLSFDSLQQSPLPHPGPAEKNIIKHPAFSPTSTMTSDAASLTFHSDSEYDLYDDVPEHLPMVPKDSPRLGRSNTMTGTKKSTVSSKWGYGWGVGKKNKEKGGGESEINEKSASQVDLPLYQPVVRRDSKSTQASHSTQRSHDTHRTQNSRHTQNTQNTQNTHRTHESQRTHVTQQSKFSQGSRNNSFRSNSSRSTAPKPRPPLINGHVLYPQDSTDTLVGSAFERKVNEQDSIRIKPDTTDRLQDMRRLMVKDKLDY